MNSERVVQMVDVASGRLAYRRWDCIDGGPPLILLHGFTGSSRSWAHLADEFTPTRTVYAFDLPGHGLTELGSAAEPCDMAGFTRALNTAIEALEISDFDLLGYSLGGRSALHFSVHAGNRPGRLILESASAGLPDAEARTARVAGDEALAQFAEADGIRAFVDRWEQSPTLAPATPRPPALIEAVRAGRLSCSSDGLAMSLRGMGTGAQPYLGGALAELSLPVLCIVGASDEKFCKLGAEMTRVLPNARLESIDGAGHSVHLDQPREYTQAVNDFIQASTDDHAASSAV